MQKLKTLNIPQYVSDVLQTLTKAGFQAYLVGGCVRDLVLSEIKNRKYTPKDWDVTTNATPEQIIPLFTKTVYENNFGTVAVVFEEHTEAGDSEQKNYIVEVTPFRLETTYTDNRHPDSIAFGKTLDEDLKRRDFTINALALDAQGNITDLFGGIEDLKKGIVRTVGEPSERFGEDALRLLRAIRFATVLDFAISHETMTSILENADRIKNISFERIRDEFVKIIMSQHPMTGIGMLSKLKLLQHIIPELEEGIGCEQKGEHIYDVFDHMLHALGHAGEKKQPLDIRLSALFHDIGKPRTRRWDGSKAGGKGKYTFYGHEVIGARMVKKIMERMKFPKDISEKVEKLVRYHMFFSDTETITLSAVRRVIVNVGKETIWDLMEVRECDRVGMKKKEAPYRLRKYHAMIEECLRDPISVSQLKVDGTILMNELGIKPGPKMGFILNALLEEVLDDPEKNIREYLDKRIMELNVLPEDELKALGQKAKEKKEELEEKEIEVLRKKHGVK
jgi:tRNA nucleotidyltransferase (CCA-adding enzyme)